MRLIVWGWVQILGSFPSLGFVLGRFSWILRYVQGMSAASTIVRLAASCLALGGFSGLVNAQSFTLLSQHFIYGLSRDGRTAVGYDANFNAMSWTAEGGVQSFGAAAAFGSFSVGGAISDDGRVIGGMYTAASSRQEVFRWTDQQIFTGVGRPTGGTQVRVTSMSADGNVMIGYNENPITTQSVGFIWTPQGGLRTLPGSNLGTRARDITADGQKVVGSRASGSGSRAFTWTEAGGTVLLPGLDSRNYGGAWAVSGDGRYVVGYGEFQVEGRYFSNPVVWENGLLRDLGRIDGYVDGHASGISDDGRVVVGILYPVDGPQAAFVWTQATGMVLMRDYLASYGVMVPGFLELSNDPMISGDGLTFAAIGGANDGLGGGFIATIPCPGAAAGMLAGVLANRRRRRGSFQRSA